MQLNNIATKSLKQPSKEPHSFSNLVETSATFLLSIYEVMLIFCLLIKYKSNVELDRLHLHESLTPLHQQKLCTNLKVCIFAASEIRRFGYIVINYAVRFNIYEREVNTG